VPLEKKKTRFPRQDEKCCNMLKTLSSRLRMLSLDKDFMRENMFQLSSVICSLLGLSKIMTYIEYVLITSKEYDYNMPPVVFSAT
jgi:hypothetical protein